MPQAVLINPRKRNRKGRFVKTGTRKRTTSKKTTRKNPTRRRKSSRRRTRRTRRNPIGFDLNKFIKSSLVPSGIGAGGALALDVLIAKIPATMMTPETKAGPMKPLIKGVGAVALGMLANQFTSKRNAEQITAGALTVAMYDAAKSFLMTQFPTLQLSEYDAPMIDINEQYPELGYTSAGHLIDGYDDPLGAYLDDNSMDGYDEPLSEYIDGYDDVYL